MRGEEKKGGVHFKTHRSFAFYSRWKTKRKQRKAQGGGGGGGDSEEEEEEEDDSEGERGWKEETARRRKRVGKKGEDYALKQSRVS